MNEYSNYDKVQKEKEEKYQREQQYIIDTGKKQLDECPKGYVYVIFRNGEIERKANETDFNGWISSFVRQVSVSIYKEHLKNKYYDELKEVEK